MPVILEQISNLSPQDHQDVAKIYQDYPNLGSQDLNQWINDNLNREQQLFAGRFNGRIVGCVWANILSNCWKLEHLAVRDITRRRGVARQLLTLLINKATASEVDLIAEDKAACEILRPLLQELAFDLTPSAPNSLTSSNQGNLWQKNHQT